MPVYPFTPAGVTAKTVDLYALDDSLLSVEIRSLVTDITAWLDANFTLSARQKNYITDAPEIAKLNWGGALAVGISQRAAITMQDVPTDYGPPRRTKQVVVEYAGSSGFFPAVVGPGIITGSANINIKFDLVD